MTKYDELTEEEVKKLNDQEWLEYFLAKDRKKNPQDYNLPDIWNDQTNQGSPKKIKFKIDLKMDPNSIIIVAIICGIILLIVSLFILLKDEPEPTEIILFTDDYSVFSDSDKIRILDKIYGTSCYISPYKFKKPGECYKGYYERLFYIRNNVVYKVVPYDHQEIIRVYNPRINGNNLIVDESHIQKTYRIPDNISISKCSKYAIIDGNIVIEGNPGLTSRVIIFVICLLVIIAYSIFFFRKINDSGCLGGLFLIAIYLFIIVMFIGSIIDLVNYF